MLRKIAGYLVLVFLLYFVVTSPREAGELLLKVVGGADVFASTLTGGGR